MRERDRERALKPKVFDPWHGAKIRFGLGPGSAEFIHLFNTNPQSSAKRIVSSAGERQRS